MDHGKSLLSRLSEQRKEAPPRPEYNLFQVLGVEANEVVLCRFLADLLNPEGAHGMGPLFLRTFLQDVLRNCPMGDALLSHTETVTEFLTETNRRIDIVIRNARYFIPIEVKLYAVEQEAQCFDYCQYARNAPIVYLTRFGRAPSEYSRRQKDGPDVLPLDRVRCISWSGDIVPWLTGRLPQLDGVVKSIVTQYIDTIDTITNRQERKTTELNQNVQTVLDSPEFFRAGLELETAMKTAKLTLLRLVFDFFKEEMAPVAEQYGLELENDTYYYSYEAPQHDKFYDTSSSTWPGLNYVVRRAKFQRESLQMWFRIEVDHQLFAGFSLFDTEAEPEYGYSGRQIDDITPELMEEAAQYLDRDVLSPSDWWFVYCYPNGKFQEKNYSDVPNFKAMNQCAIDLVDPQKRREYVRQAIKVFEAKLLAHLSLPS